MGQRHAFHPRPAGPVAAGSRPPQHGNLWTHLTAAVVVPGCLVLCWWQVTRALDGNTLSWAYVFEWPVFAGYGVFMWWRLVHERPRSGAPGPGGPGPTASAGETALPPDTAPPEAAGPVDPTVVCQPTGTSQPVPAPVAPVATGGPGEEDEELAAYNRYLAALHASGRRKHW